MGAHVPLPVVAHAAASTLDFRDDAPLMIDASVEVPEIAEADTEQSHQDEQCFQAEARQPAAFCRMRGDGHMTISMIVCQVNVGNFRLVETSLGERLSDGRPVGTEY